MLKKVSAIALVAAAVFSAAGCAETIVGKGEASSEVTEQKSLTMEDISFPEDSFYGDDVDVDDDPDDPYQRICDSNQTFDIPEGVESKVRKVKVSPPSVGGDDANIFIDETVLIFPDAEGAQDFVGGFDDTAENCPPEDSYGEVTYTYAEPTKYDHSGWKGWASEITLDIAPSGETPTEGSESDILAHKGNVVGYASWESDPVDDVDDAMSEINGKIDEFFAQLTDDH